MSELDEIWAQKLDDAIAEAEKAGRRDVAAYLTLKANNDALRQTGVQWLFGAMLQIAAAFPHIKIENESTHRFPVGAAQMIGSLLRFRQGVRCLTVEAGWTRTPADGFMRGNALAAARLNHFGMARQNVALVLLRTNDAPQWFAVDDENRRTPFNSQHLNIHFQIFKDY